MKPILFQGSCVALVTPMRPDTSVDYTVLGELIDWQIAQGTDALLLAGTTGEGSTLDDGEHLEVIRYAVHRAKGRVPVLAGAGSNNTAHAVYLSREAEKAGADALLHVTPYYNKASQKGLLLHFQACAAAVRLPVLLYNVPSRTGVNILPETYRALSEVDNIVAVKEAGGNLAQIAKTAALCGGDLHIYSGNDDQVTALLALGAKGVVSVLANIAPQDTHRMCQAFFDGDLAESRRLQLFYKELIEALFSDVNPIPVKQALCDLGWKVGGCRLPLCDMEDKAHARLRETLGRYGLLPERSGDTVTVRFPVSYAKQGV